MTTRRPLLLVLTLCAASLASATTATGYSVTASGSFTCRDNSNSWPVPGAKVEILNSNSSSTDLLDQRMGTGYTDGSGNYRISASGGDLFSKPDVYARITLSDGSVTMRNLLGIAATSSNWKRAVQNVSGSVSLGTTALGSNGSSSECGVYVKTREVYQQFIAENGHAPVYGALSVISTDAATNGFPWTLVNSIQWPIGFSASTTNSGHEFGHSVRHSLDGISSGTYTLSNALSVLGYNIARFGYARNHSDCDLTNEGFAFNEGWAEYYSGEKIDRCDNTSMKIEGNVARALTALSKCAAISGHKNMINVLANHPQQIYSYSDFERYALRAYPTCA